MSALAPVLASEVRRRRTFAIISHPDAGKTTLTEKLLLYGGAIHLAGSVKARKAQRHAVSDWMELERQRGISITSSVLQFEYDGYKVNILDTPGHQDFSEDTYRTLMAADSAVMLIDAAKGVEEQTKKLFHVCRMRGIPIFTFINKLDRHGRDPFELMQEIENVLGIRSCPINWPIGMGNFFRGVYNRELAQIEVFQSGGHHGQSVVASTRGSVDDPVLAEFLGKELHAQLCEEIELLDMAGDQFDLELVRKGQLTPVFFGSALTNFGVRPFLEDFLRLAPAPGPRDSSGETIAPHDERFSAFVFKIQANMNPAHRDRIAFMRICSGKFERGMSAVHVPSGKEIRLSQPQQFVAQDRMIVEEAYPGDIIGLFDPGIFGIGDTISSDGSIQFEGIPSFPPEHFVQIHVKDAMKRKQFVKGINQLSEEGAIQVFRKPDIGVEAPIIGAIGMLQFDVLTYRLSAEYGVEVRMEHLPYKVARWVGGSFDPKSFDRAGTSMLVEDEGQNPVVLFSNEWSLRWAADRNKNAVFSEVPPRYEKAG